MVKGSDDLINDILADSELAIAIVPNKFKHTSKKGRARRQQLLMGAKRLLEVYDVKDISLADICKEAKIPRASAYHFFPNVDSIFLAIRFLNLIDISTLMKSVSAASFKSWDAYLARLLTDLATLLNNDSCMNKLLYGCDTPDFGTCSDTKQADEEIVGFIISTLSSHYNISKYNDLEFVLLVTYSLANSIFALSYRRHGKITDELLQEAIKASTAYLNCYLPESLEKL